MAYIEEKIKALEEGLEDITRIVNELRAYKAERIYSVAQIAEETNLSTGAINRHIRVGNLKAEGKRNKRIRESDYNKFKEYINKYRNQD